MEIRTDSAEYRNHLELMSEAIVHFKATKMISFIENMGARSEDDQNYTINDWFPRVMKFGYTGVAAIIQPENAFSQMSLDLMVENNTHLDPDNPLQYFSENNVQGARDWLKNIA